MSDKDTGIRTNPTVRAFGAFLPRNPLHWFGVLVTAGLIAGIAGFTVLVTGVLSLNAAQPHGQGLARLLHFAFSRSVANQAENAPPPPTADTDEDLVQLAAGHYANACSNCHGAPGLGQNPVALSMRPEPPKLDGAAEKYSGEELFYIIEQGVAYSAMPAWPVLNRAEEVWAMVRFVQAIPDMSFETYAQLAYNRDLQAGGGDPEAASFDGLAVAAFGQDPSAFGVPSPGDRSERPYLPGEVQSRINIDDATNRPAVGFVPSGIDGRVFANCAQCHGNDGAGPDGGVIPNLTLQSEDYIYETLVAYAHGFRQSGIMWPVAAQLSEPQMRSVAAYMGSQAPKPSGADTDVSDDLLSKGQEIAENGIPRERYADTAEADNLGTTAAVACNNCHGDGDWREAVVPHIAGQHAGYLAMQMNAFANGGRGGAGDYNPMVSVGHKLTVDEIEAVAAYYASLPPEPKEDGASSEASDKASPEPSGG
ncbi:MAG: c-type cytochrome [Geminicoccaceae bacterium]